ncbi:acyltransferase [Nocardia sp. BMG111209]|uniref:acyltransferase family protein n=1 Tax=Nocardia sp. BMG111209 TaxID=1160137 RepID=UPI00037F19D3|nr:acyltransferase [Nocardia sp. BMG111209]
MTTVRNWTIDVLRIFSLTIVVLMHWVSLRVTMTGRELHADQAMHGPLMWTLTWLLQIMPLYFLCGGFANTVVADRYRREQRSYGAYLGLRARRLTTPVIALIVVVVPAIAILRAVSPSVARAAGDAVSRPVWFLAVYLVAVAFTPLALRAHERSPWLVPVVLLACSVTVDMLRFAAHDSRFVDANLIFVWLFCHQLGILYARGTLRTLGAPALILLALAAIGLIVVMVIPGPYFPTVLGMADAPVSNLSPPTSVLSVLGVAHFALLTLFEKRRPAWEPTGRLRGVVQGVNPLLMLIYLWHLPVLTALTGVALVKPSIFLPGDPATWWLTRIPWFAVGIVVLVGVVRLATQWELFCARYAERTNVLAVGVATALSATGIYEMWRHALTLDTASVLGALGVLAAGVLLTAHRVPAADTLSRTG